MAVKYHLDSITPEILNEGKNLDKICIDDMANFDLAKSLSQRLTVKGPRWPSGKASTQGPDGRRPETRFHRRSAVYGARSPPNHTQWPNALPLVRRGSLERRVPSQASSSSSDRGSKLRDDTFRPQHYPHNGLVSGTRGEGSRNQEEEDDTFRFIVLIQLYHSRDIYGLREMFVSHYDVYE
ncbi:hypothetical protein AVEN_71464-1 [Araneus ventricosus]|uniref:Uncharacterized protein n=1 Tax=Araneus ventricosus TaxID=182803 RepID=A0A4Y2CVP8_ARAVE|nr:hypothetical protein AVEN_71464-1 [Araneus ventricosus]